MWNRSREMLAADGALDFAESDQSISDKLISADCQRLKLPARKYRVDLGVAWGFENHVAQFIGNAQQFKQRSPARKTCPQAARTSAGAVNPGHTLSYRPHLDLLFI